MILLFMLAVLAIIASGPFLKDCLRASEAPRSLSRVLGFFTRLYAAVVGEETVGPGERSANFEGQHISVNSYRNSSPATGALPLPARARIRFAFATLPRAARSLKKSSVLSADSFSATATLMN